MRKYLLASITAFYVTTNGAAALAWHPDWREFYGDNDDCCLDGAGLFRGLAVPVVIIGLIWLIGYCRKAK